MTKWNQIAQTLFRTKAIKKEIERQEKELEKTLRELSSNTTAASEYFVYKKELMNGAIDYKAIVEYLAPKIDLEPYRKKSITRWNLIQIKEMHEEKTATNY